MKYPDDSSDEEDNYEGNGLASTDSIAKVL